MAKESSAGMDCMGCGHRIYYMEQHFPHCQPARERMATLKKVTIEDDKKTKHKHGAKVAT